MKRSFVYVDTMLAQLAELSKTWRAEYGQPLDQVTNVPVSTILYDVLAAIGVPDNGAALVLAIQQHHLTQPVENHLTCAYCDQPAASLARLRNGSSILVCNAHAAEADRRGLAIITRPQGCELEL